jgi:hypothetical protein
MLAACSPPHRFEIKSDEPIARVTGDFTNAKRVEARVDGEASAVVTAHSGDDSGIIQVALRRGQLVDCRVGYVTNGEPEPHRMKIENGRCSGV